MDSQFTFQLGAQLTAIGTQMQQLAQAIQANATQLQETRDLYEALARQQGWMYSQDAKQWVHRDAVPVK